MSKKNLKVHRRYDDRPERAEDLGVLSVCNDMSNKHYEPQFLTSDDAKVTCGRCRRIKYETAYGRGGKNPPSRPFNARDYRKMSRDLAGPKNIARANQEKKLAVCMERAELKDGVEEAVDTARFDMDELEKHLSKMIDSFGEEEDGRKDADLATVMKALDEAIFLAMGLVEDLEDFGRRSGLRPEHMGRTTARPATMGVTKKNRRTA